MRFVDNETIQYSQLYPLIQRQNIKWALFTLAGLVVYGRRSRGKEGKQQASPLCPAQLCYSSSGGKTVYCQGQGPRHMFTGSLRWAIVVKAHPVHGKATLKIISNRAPLPWGQKKPILTRFIRASHKRTFKTHLEFQDKTSPRLVICLLWLFPFSSFMYSSTLM